MKKTITLLNLVLFTVILNAQTFTFEWANSTSGNSTVKGYGIGIDANQNIYSVSNYEDTIDADPSANTLNFISNGGSDIIIQKFDLNGNIIWAKSIGNSNDDEAFDLVVDSIGNCYVIGNFKDTVDFDPSTNTYNVDGEYYGIFILKLDKDGNFVWVNYAHSNSLKYGFDLALNNDNDKIYATGYFSYGIIFTDGLGDQSFSSNGSYDTFVWELDSSGNNLLTTHFGGSSQETGYGITCDNNGNIYLTGYYVGTGNFDPNGTYNLTSNGSWDAYINKLDASGNFLWAKSFGGSQIDKGEKVVCDNIGNVYLTGYYKDSVDFNPNAGINYYYSSSDNIFLEKLSPAGDYLWCYASETSTGKPKNITYKNNAVYIIGYATESVDFNPDTTIITTVLERGAFIAKYFNGGALDKVTIIGDTQYNSGYSMVLSDDGRKIISTGRFRGTCDFDPSDSDVFEMTSADNSYDAYIQEIYDCHILFNTVSEHACDSYTSPSGSYVWTTSGIYKDTIPSQHGCDSVITINLTIDDSPIVSLGNDTTICEGTNLAVDAGVFVSYLWNDSSTNQILSVNQTGEYFVEVTNINGCSNSDTIIVT
ncbi:MAG: hypothetical protein DRP35_10135, partial [Candidatus Zixiibacteriota bacterium]